LCDVEAIVNKKAKPSKRPPGRPLKLGRHQPYLVRLPPELHRQIKLYSVSKGLSLNDLLIDIIRDWWSRQPERAGIARLASARPRK
jgi:predicted HicB family RNase H-like nuclease